MPGAEKSSSVWAGTREFANPKNLAGDQGLVNTLQNQGVVNKGFSWYCCLKIPKVFPSGSHDLPDEKLRDLT
jgi:hypothetical protein